MTARRSRPSGGGSGPLAATLALLAAVLVAGCGPASGSVASADPVATSAVDLPKSYRFTPEAITVAAGTTVTWTNSDNFMHNVAFEGQEPLTMSPGATASRTFDTAGTYPYVCSLHPTDMRGSVRVTGG